MTTHTIHTIHTIQETTTPNHDHQDPTTGWYHSAQRHPRTEPVAFPTRRKANIMGNTFDQAKGRIKQAVGDLTGNKKLRAEGKSDEAAGRAKQVVTDAKRKTDTAVNQAKENLNNRVDKAKNNQTKN